jgi:hypothetical protein
MKRYNLKKFFRISILEKDVESDHFSKVKNIETNEIFINTLSLQKMNCQN